MLKIGELAKICNVNVQTLRYYEKIGVLDADFIDTESGYRYYKPDKIKVYHKILHLKELEFSLAEIRQFLTLPYKEQCRMYQAKKMSILESMNRLEEKIKQIDTSCENPNAGIIPLNEQILKIAFEDDPRVVGKWVYCGNSGKREKFITEDNLAVRDVMEKNLYFCPGGTPVWMYFWTKGILYYIFESYNILIPNEYRIFDSGSKRYMAIDFMSDRFMGTFCDDTIRIYRQENTHEYTVKETYEFRDDVNRHFIPDNRVLGEWETVDCIRNKLDFTANSDKWKNISFPITGITFFERGICYKTWKNGTHDVGYSYTSEVVMNPVHEYAEYYEIRTHDGTDFLILEHKSGDYSYLGKIYSYYVFRRKSR